MLCCKSQVTVFPRMSTLSRLSAHFVYDIWNKHPPPPPSFNRSPRFYLWTSPNASPPKICPVTRWRQCSAVQCRAAQSYLSQFFQVLLRNCCPVEQNKWLSCDIPPLPPLRQTGLLLPSPTGPELNRNRYHSRGCEFVWPINVSKMVQQEWKWVQCHHKWKNIGVFQNTDALPSVVFKITDKFGFGK